MLRGAFEGPDHGVLFWNIYNAICTKKINISLSINNAMFLSTMDTDRWHRTYYQHGRVDSGTLGP